MMEVEENGRLPFLNILLSRMDDHSICHQFFQKKTHTKHYLHASSHHFLAQKFGVLSTLATRALRISDDSHLEQERSHLLEVFNNLSKIHKFGAPLRPIVNTIGRPTYILAKFLAQ